MQDKTTHGDILINNKTSQGDLRAQSHEEGENFGTRTWMSYMMKQGTTPNDDPSPIHKI